MHLYVHVSWLFSIVKPANHAGLPHFLNTQPTKHGVTVLRHWTQPTKIFRPGCSKVQNLSIKIREDPHPLFYACAVQMQELEGPLDQLGLQCVQGRESEQFWKKGFITFLSMRCLRQSNPISRVPTAHGKLSLLGLAQAQTFQRRLARRPAPCSVNKGKFQ